MFRNSGRRHRNVQMKEEQTSSHQPFFSKSPQSLVQKKKEAAFFQTKLSIGAPNDKYEKEADAVANAVVNKSQSVPGLQQREISSIQRLATPLEDEKLSTNDARMAKDKEIQEKPEVQQMTEPEKKEDEIIQPKVDGTTATASPPLSGRIENTSGKGKALPAKTQRDMGSSFGTDFSHVNIHTGEDAVQMNKELNAQAFTHGSDIYFNQGKYDPQTTTGKQLLAHELTHVVQQNPEKISRKKLGNKFSHTKGTKSPYKKITADFDGRNFTVFGDSVQIMQVAAQSGRPYSVRAKDALSCGGSTSDSYLNNPLYVGISDNGPIPEGSFKFKASEFATFSTADQAEMLLGGTHTDPFGQSMHGGDWGSGRVALKKISVKSGKKGCGDTSKRSGFYLHGGVMPGSSGCIDIGDSGISSLLSKLNGFTGDMIVNVNYKFPAPVVNAPARALGRFMYPKGDNPTLLDRLGSVLGGDSE